MYSVFLVDDERIVLEGIRNKIDWTNSGFTFAGEANDGEIALASIQDVKPDILITDIKMPFMDGLELARRLKKSQPWIRIIILSGHDEFEYAKEAIKIGVEDYILKPFSSEEILKSLNKVKESLDIERKQISDYDKLKEELESNTNYIKTNLLCEILSSSCDYENVSRKLSELGIELKSKKYKILVSNLFVKNDDDSVLKNVSSKILRYSQNRDDLILFWTDQRRFVSIIQSNSSTEIEDEAYTIAGALEHLVIQNMDCNIISAIGKTVDSISMFYDSYEDASQILGMTKFYNKSRIVNSDDVSTNEGGMLSLRDDDPLVDRIKYANKNEISKIVDQFLEMIESNSQQFSIISNYLFMDVIVTVSKLVENLGGDIKDVMPEILQHSFVQNAVTDKSTFISEVTKILEKILDYRDSKMQGRYGDVILKAKDYIQENYQSQDICLNSVAEEVHLSPNHFSTVFSQECGITFIEFLTNVRMENARRLLKETDLKTADIAYECGFSDPHYFSFIFKKNEGMSPRDYRSENNHSADE